MLSRLRAHFLLLEWVLPVGFTVLVLFFNEPLRLYFPALINGLRQTIYGTIATIFGSLLGFVIAGVTILISMGETPRLKLMFQYGLFVQVIAIFNSAAKWLAFGAFVSIAGLVLDRDVHVIWWYSWLDFCITIVCALRIWRCIWVLGSVLDLVLRDKKPAGKQKVRNMPLEGNPRRGLD